MSNPHLDAMPHPSTHSRQQHHSWLDRLIRDPRTDAAMAVSILTTFAVSLGHPTEEGRRIASKLMTGIASGWGAVKAFDTYFGHHFKDDR
jgi:hypothetical protein